jgi:hypothetical protein
MRAYWVIPAICYGPFLALEFLIIDSALRPDTTILAFVGLYIFLPLLAFLLASLLCASDAGLPLKLLFPVVLLVSIPLCYQLIEAGGLPRGGLSLTHLSADFSLALLIVFSPAVLGCALGFIVRTIRKRRAQHEQTTARTQTGKARHTRTPKSRQGVKAPPLTVRLNTARRVQAGLGVGRRTEMIAPQVSRSRRRS